MATARKTSDSSLKKKAKARAKTKTAASLPPLAKADQKAPKEFLPPMNNAAPPLPPALTYLRKLATIPSLRQKG